MNARIVVTQAVEGTDAASLQAALNAALAAMGEASYLDIKFSMAYTGSGVSWGALILYTK